MIFREELVILLDFKLSLEYRDVALRAEHLAASGRSRENVSVLLQTLEDIAEPVKIITRMRPLSPDPDDDMVLDVALNGKAEAIVTNNMRHFAEPGRRLGILVESPADLLRRIKRGDHDAD